MIGQYRSKLVFSQGADMCSLQKTVCKGGAMKIKHYVCYCCNIHISNLATLNLIHYEDYV